MQVEGPLLTVHSDPPQKRFMFFDDSHIVQMQSDWFAYNWRKTQSSPDYERYEPSRYAFEKHFNSLCSFLEESQIQLQPTQTEITYVNRIASSSLLSNVGPFGSLFKDIQPTAGKYLPSPSRAQSNMDIRNIRGRLWSPACCGGNGAGPTNRGAIRCADINSTRHSYLSRHRRDPGLFRSWP